MKSISIATCSTPSPLVRAGVRLKNIFKSICSVLSPLGRVRVGLVLSLLFTTSIKAQDEDCPVCGWYVDGVKVDKLECYTFDKLQIVLPYNSGWGGYDKIRIVVGAANKGYVCAMKTVQGSAIKTFVKGNYLVYSVFAKEYGQKTNGMTIGHPSQSSPSTFSRGGLANGEKKKGAKAGDPAPDGVPLVGYAEGLTITGYKETYDQTQNAIVKTPNYEFTIISKEYPFTCTNRTVQKSKWVLDEVDLSIPCTASGTKVDFNNLGNKSGGSSSNNNSSSNTEETTTVTKTTVTKTNGGTNSGNATGKTIITTAVVKTQAQLKPLDKTKPGYFEEKDGGKITRAGYKKGDDYLGEVREYNTDGTVSEVSVYTGGIQDGLTLKFDGDGKLELSGYYKNGNSDGTWQWFSNGVLSKTTKYVNGQEQ